jgi:hypothetical protein
MWGFFGSTVFVILNGTLQKATRFLTPTFDVSSLRAMARFGSERGRAWRGGKATNSQPFQS